SMHIPLVFAGFILFDLLMNAGPNATTFTLAPILFPTQLRATASGFAAGVAKLGATLGVFVLPILKGKFGVPAVLGMVAAVSALGLVITLIFGHEDTEQERVGVIDDAVSNCPLRPILIMKNSCFPFIETSSWVNAEIGETNFRLIVVRAHSFKRPHEERFSSAVNCQPCVQDSRHLDA